MQKYISFALITTLSLAQMGSLSAETGSLDAEISRINASITGSLDSAPVPIDSNPLLYNPWELLHRGPMIDGFQWTGEIAQYITPHMYDGTPFASKDIIGTPSMTDFLVEEATNYSECLTNELYLSFGLGERIESSDIGELKAIAKSCAQQFYGTYFDGKSYTTREEYLMMLLTVFGEDVSFEGDFTDDGRYVSTGTGVESGFANVALTAWYSPYLAYADEIGILSTDEVKWSVAKMISDREAIDMLSLYTAYRMGYTGTDMLQKGMIQIKNYEYNFIFISVSEVKIEVKTDSVKKIAIDTKKASNLFPSGSFYEMLDNCQASITKFKHPFTGEMMKKEIVGISNNKCIYIEEMPNNGKMTCSYNDIERRIAAQFYYHISTNDYSANASTSNGKATSTYEINGKVYNNPLQDFLDNEICIITGY